MSHLMESGRTLDWEASLTQLRERSERRAWSVAKAACLVAIACATALAVLVPFYRVVPLPIEVNRLTGDAQVIDILDAKRIRVSEIADKHWVDSYVQMRERYDWMLLQMDYDAVRTMSDEKVARDYGQIYDGAQALDKVLGVDAQRRVRITSTTLPPGEPGRAVVHFVRTTRRNGVENAEPAECFVATLAYTYEPKVLQREKEAVANPFGFRVTAYVRDPDYGPCDATASQAVSATGVATTSPGALVRPAMAAAAGETVNDAPGVTR